MMITSDNLILQEAYGNVHKKPMQHKVKSPEYMNPNHTNSIADDGQSINDEEVQEVEEGCSESSEKIGSALQDIAELFRLDLNARRHAARVGKIESILNTHFGEEDNNPFNDETPPDEGPPQASNPGQKQGSNIPEPPSQSGMGAAGFGG